MGEEGWGNEEDIGGKRNNQRKKGVLTCLPNQLNSFTRLANSYTLLPSAPTNVGVYSPVGVDSAKFISAPCRTLNVGLPLAPSAGEEMELRRRGHSIMALERVLRRMGRYVSFVYWPGSSTSASAPPKRP